MTAVTVAASDVRVPEEARRAVEARRPVQVVAHERPRYVILHPADYAFVSSVLERHHQGRPVPIERLLTDDDFAVLAEDSDGELATDLLETWSA
jgi:hypothetical protein